MNPTIKTMLTGLAGILASFWIGGILLTFLPDSAIALHFAALGTMITGVVCSVVWTLKGWNEFNQKPGHRW